MDLADRYVFMVIEDVPLPSQTQKSEVSHTAAARVESTSPMAPPIDRLAAFVADLVLLVPLLSLVTAPLRRQWQLAELMRDSEGRLFVEISIVLGVVIAVSLFNTVFLAIWGATPGKRLLGLRVRSLWTLEKPTAKQAFLRSLFFCAETFLFCLPWLGVLTNVRRRPWHDRVADTEVVVTDPKKAVVAPDVRELGLASSVQIAALCALMLLTMATLVRSHRDRGEGSVTRVSPSGDDNAFLCSSITETHEEWLSTDGETPSRVEVALALFGAEAVGERCLEAEADYALWNGKGGAAAYFAKSLALTDDSESATAYTKKTCEIEPNGVPCRLARFLMAPMSGREEMLRSFGTKTPAYARVYVVQRLIEESRFDDALGLIDTGSPHRRLGYFFASHRAQALWSLRRSEEARLSFRSALEGLPASQRLRLSRWFCDAEIMSSCSPEAVQSCGLLAKAVEKAPGELEETETALAWIRAQECAAGGAPDYKKMQARVPGPDAQSFLSALLKLKANDTTGAKSGLEQVVSDSEEDSPFWFEAQSRLVVLAESETELRPILERWKKSESAEAGWLRVGHLLLKRLEKLGQTKRAVEVGSRILDWDPFDESLRRRLVVWAYNAGEIQTALRSLERLKQSSMKAARMPAQAPHDDTEFERVARELANAVLAPPPDTFPREELEP